MGSPVETSVAASPVPVATTVASAPVAPATASPVTLDSASFLQLLKAAGVRVEGEAKTDVEDIAHPSKLLAAVKALPSEFEAGIKYVNWPLVIVGVIAISALVLHFPKIIAAVL
jgi:hypothetical protein